jgi:hypothetical protein
MVEDFLRLLAVGLLIAAATVAPKASAEVSAKLAPVKPSGVVVGSVGVKVAPTPPPPLRVDPEPSGEVQEGDLQLEPNAIGQALYICQADRSLVIRSDPCSGDRGEVAGHVYRTPRVSTIVNRKAYAPHQGGTGSAVDASISSSSSSSPAAPPPAPAVNQPGAPGRK